MNFFIAALLSGVALFILSAVNDLLFLNWLVFYRLALFLLFFLGYLFFFIFYDPNFFFLKYAFLILASTLLFWEALSKLKTKLTTTSVGWRIQLITISLVLALILAQVAWVLITLPVSGYAAASFLAIINFLLSDYVFLRLENKPGHKLQVVFGTAFLAVVGIMVMIFTKWGI